MREKEIILEVKDLKTTFKVGRKKVHAVNGVTYSLRRGKTLCVVGRRQAGLSC